MKQEPIWIDLTDEEMNRAIYVGVCRQRNNMKNKRRQAHGAEGDAVAMEHRWDYHIEGAGAELAVALWLRVPWDGNLENFDADDAGPHQVRQTWRQYGHLILHKRDKDHKAFILVTGLMPRFAIRGWLLASDGKLPKYRDDKGHNGRPCFWVPQDVLHHMKDLPREPAVAAVS